MREVAITTVSTRAFEKEDAGLLVCFLLVDIDM